MAGQTKPRADLCPYQKGLLSLDYLVATVSAVGLVPCIFSVNSNRMNECLFVVTSSVSPELSVTHRYPIKQPFFSTMEESCGFLFAIVKDF